MSVAPSTLMAMTDSTGSPFAEETLDRLFGQDIDPADYITFTTGGGRRWTGDVCGCLDPGCIGRHHAAGQTCPCLFPLMAEFSKSRMIGELREEMHERKVSAALVEQSLQSPVLGDLTLSLLAADPDVSVFAMLNAVNATRAEIMRADAAEDAADL